MVLRLAPFYAAVFLSAGIYMPFWPVWLESRGMGPAEIGILLSASTWVRAVAPLAVAHLADRRGERRRLIVLLCAGALVGFALFTLAREFWALLAVTLLVAVFYSGVIPLGENLTMLTAARHGLDYGRIRLWGSIAFIAASWGGGLVLTGRVPGLVLWGLIGSMVLILAAGLALPDARTAPAQRHRMPVLSVLRDRRFPVFLAACSLIQASHATYYGFSTLHWRAAGHSEGMIGALWAEGVVAEVVLFLFSAPLLARLGPVRLLALAAGCGVLRWSVLGATTALPALAAVQVLHAFTFAATHLAAMHLLVRMVPAEVSATAQSLYSGLSMGVVMGLTMIAAGWLYGLAGGAAFYAMAAMALAGLGAVLLLRAMGGTMAAAERG